MALTQVQEEVLVLIGLDAAEGLDAGQLLVVDALSAAGLAVWAGETPVLTAAGRACLDRMLMD